jgi:hypothetical protein
MTAYTPGPWRFLEEGDTESEHNRCRPLTVCGPGDDDLANVYSRDDATVTISREESIANARLIAAAPDLLESCKALDAVLCGGFDTPEKRAAGRSALIAARTAITLATRG